MKLITCVIQPTEVEDLKEELTAIQIGGITVSETKGFVRQKEGTQLWQGTERAVDLVPSVELEVVVPDTMVGTVLDTVMNAGKIGKIGDGKIFVQDVCEAVRIRTGELDDSAL
jgi:nitrogen regulatory protein P-II 2